jgi:5-methylcytosine-specific restriction enzyme subunit McrC
VERIVFHDLGGPARALRDDEDAWLRRLVRDTEARELVVSVARSCSSSRPGAILRRTPEGEWRAGRYVGELHRDGRVLEIRPRLGAATIAAWSGAALGIRVQAPETGRVTGEFAAELLAGAWRSAVIAPFRHGPPGLRATRQRQGVYARGRLDVRRTLALRAAGEPYLSSRESFAELDNPITRAIVLADRVLDRALERPDWRGPRIDEVMPRLREAVGPRPALPTRRELAAVRYTPIMLPYRRAAELSLQIASHRGLRSTATGAAASGALLDVGELWELFLVHCARRAFGASAVTHGTRLRALRAAAGRSRPDLIVGSRRAPLAVVAAGYESRSAERFHVRQLTELGLAGARLRVVACVEEPGAAGGEGDASVRVARLPAVEEECVQALGALFSAA